MLEGLADARKAAGLSRDEVAARLGVHYNTLKNWELGATEPKGTVIAALAEMYGCTVEALMGLDGGCPETEGDAA